MIEILFSWRKKEEKKKTVCECEDYDDAREMCASNRKLTFGWGMNVGVLRGSRIYILSMLGENV